MARRAKQAALPGRSSCETPTACDLSSVCSLVHRFQLQQITRLSLAGAVQASDRAGLPAHRLCCRVR